MFLGIDIGTSAVKVIVAPASGDIVTTASVSLPISSPHSLWSEQAPDDWWTATKAACAEARSNAPEAWSKIAAIGLSGQMHGATVLGADRRPLRPAILWNDGRAFAECAVMAENFPDHGRFAGVPAMPGFTAPKILWLRDHEPDTYAAIAHILLPKDYIRLQLTGELATDMADAAGTLWLDEAERKWSTTLCEASATDPAWLPTLYEGTEESGRLNGEAAETLGLGKNIPVAAGGGDAATGAVGIGAVKSGDAFLSLGTSGQFFIADETYRPNPESYVHAFAHAVPDRWFRMGVMLNGASPLAWFSSVSGADIPTLLAEAQEARADRVPLFLPYLTGERSPHNDPYIRGTFSGLETSTTRGEMARAVIDAIAYCFRDARDSLAAAGGVVDRAMAIGGGTRSDLVLQTLSDALDLTLVRTVGADTGPAYGAARLAAVMTGDLSLDDLAEKPATKSTFQPRADETSRHAERHKRYQALYRALAPLARPEEAGH
ncbi:xylulokinase [Notoacmeibacter sp. MSK16QG-6]|uniref:xylulokinase n=1 Tax=Notoacmeibacter sp. MSK16QG-6 TaxID=2957982 RepID=UPI00209F19DD|nr:xylulokinase [Notoacmeibacter sp. MSK16QG-6]MCP1200030.1 xylulokinase [Notoacmeibacter sp. MSK16QG-6]